jgi:hypothetical protein
MLPAEVSFNDQHRKDNHYDGSGHHSKRDPCQSAVILAGLTGICISFITANQEKSKVGEMIGFTATKILCFASAIGCVGAFGVDSGEALVFTCPFSFTPFIEAQTKPLVLLCVVGQGQTDGQWRVQSIDGLPWPSKRVMFRTVLASTCRFKEEPVAHSYEVTKVVLAWLLKLGGTKRAPTTPSPG